MTVQHLERLSAQASIIQSHQGWSSLDICLVDSTFLMVENGISQLHPHGVLLWSDKNIRFPLYRNMSHARKVMQGSPQVSTITLGNSKAEVSNRVRQTIPPGTGKLTCTRKDYCQRTY